ncbi:Integral membrane protein [Fusarium acuminatum]|uniref:Integral membrane protein n=1 Tax=Fusarium acuminatum TaxID=5515 RepID=A0ABZ2WGT6_9HYPO
MISEDIPSESNAVQIYSPSILFFVLTPVFVALRFWNRGVRRSGLGWDDTTIVISFLCALAVQGVMIASCNYGFGRHISTLALEDKSMALKLFYIAQIFYKLTINLAKISMLLLYLRIFVQEWFRRCCFTLMAIIASYMAVALALSIWQCHPLSGAWDKSLHPKCVSLDKTWHANAGFKRALITVITMGGGVVIVTSIVRMTTLKKSTNTADTTFNITSTMWTIIEQNLAIICTCLPMCRIPLATLFPPWFSTSIITTPSASRFNDRPGSQPRVWNPYVGPKSVQGLTQSVVLPNDESMASDVGVIRKTVEYGVTYETNPECPRYSPGS